MTSAQPPQIRIPVYRPELGAREAELVDACLQSSWISSRGEFLTRFEDGFACFVGTPHAAAVTNGTVALHLALLALGIGPGDEVIVPTLTYVASVNAIAYVGATPVFCESEGEIWQACLADVAARITPRTRAIMAVHLYGAALDMPALCALAAAHDLAVVEDCAEAIGTLCQGRHVGTFGDVATFSFFGNKTITTGEGGMVLTRTRALHDKIVHFKGQGLARNREYWHDVIGYNYRMTNICAAIGVAQLERVVDFLERKARLAARYRERLASLPLRFQNEPAGRRHSHWMISLTVANRTDRDPLRAHLATRGIETRPLFFPVHSMPMYAAPGAHFPVAEDVAARGISLPSWPGLADGQVDEVCAAITGYYSAKGSGR